MYELCIWYLYSVFSIASLTCSNHLCKFVLNVIYNFSRYVTKLTMVNILS